jgi:membrane protease YdiL (CAAX protease family)
MSAFPEESRDDLADGPNDPAPIRAPRRIPNLGHALLFASFTGLVLILLELAATLLGKSPAAAHGGAIGVLHPKVQIAIEASAYAVTLLAAGLFFPLVWRRGFLDGLSWNWAAARAEAGKLAGLGLLLGAMMQIVTYFITPPKTMPIDDFFAKASDAWLVTFFGVVVAPIFEEIAFRGFLLPAFAVAYDWLSLPRTEEARIRWRTTTALTTGGYAFSAVFTSVLFALLHAEQVAHLWAALLVLFSVSLLLTYVRVKTQSVAASAIVHGAYNGFVFLTVLIATGGYRHLDRMTR